MWPGAGSGGRTSGTGAGWAEPQRAVRDRRALLWVWTRHAAFRAFVPSPFPCARTLLLARSRPLSPPSVSLSPRFSRPPSPPPTPRSSFFHHRHQPDRLHVTGYLPTNHLPIRVLWIKFDLVSGRGGHPSVDPFLPPAHTGARSRYRWYRGVCNMYLAAEEIKYWREKKNTRKTKNPLGE